MLPEVGAQRCEGVGLQHVDHDSGASGGKCPGTVRGGPNDLTETFLRLNAWITASKTGVGSGASGKMTAREEQARLEPLTHGQLHHPFHWALSCSSFNKWNSKRSFQPISALPRMAQDEETPAGPVAKATATLHEP